MDFKEPRMNFYKGLEFPFAAHVADGHRRTHVPKYYGIQFHETGTLNLRIGKQGKMRSYHGAVVFITHPGAEFSYEFSDAEKHNYYAICFTGSRVAHYLRSGLLSLAPRVHRIADPERFRKAILDFCLLRKHEEYDFCTLKLEELLLLLRRPDKPRATNQVTPYQAEKLEKLADGIRREPGKQWDFASEAAKMHISLRHFRTLFTRVNRISPGHFLLRERLDRAAKELLTTQDPVQVIADRNGYDDEFYFSRLFKKYYRLAPRFYREEFSSQKEP